MPCYSPLTAYKGKSTDSGKMCLSFKRSEGLFGSFSAINLPCGQCIGCRLERSRQWAVRCMHEASLHDENSFLTSPIRRESLRGGSLHLPDFQNFMKRLRSLLRPSAFVSIIVVNMATYYHARIITPCCSVTISMIGSFLLSEMKIRFTHRQSCPHCGRMVFPLLVPSHLNQLPT